MNLSADFLLAVAVAAIGAWNAYQSVLTSNALLRMERELRKEFDDEYMKKDDFRQWTAMTAMLPVFQERREVDRGRVVENSAN